MLPRKPRVWSARRRPERDRAAAVEAERARQKAQDAAEAAEAQRRAANKAHRQRINQEALAALVAIIGEIKPEDTAENIGKHIIVGIAQDKVPHVTINY